MKHSPEAIAIKAAELRALFAEAIAALSDPKVLEAVALLALEHSEISWEPVALVAAALNVQRELAACVGGSAQSPTAAPPLPLPSSAVPGGGPAISLPLPQWAGFR